LDLCWGETRRYWGALWPSFALWPSPSPLPPPQIKSDKQQLGSVIYSIQGPGVDEEPRNVFSIDKFTGRVYLNATLDREKTDRFRVGPVGSQTAQLLFPT
jgi:cadherin 15 (M-cadherin)